MGTRLEGVSWLWGRKLNDEKAEMVRMKVRMVVSGGFIHGGMVEV